MAGRAMALGQEPRVLVTRVALSHLGRHVIGGCSLSDVRWNDGFHEVGVLRLGHWFKSYSRHRMSLDARRLVRSQAPAAALDYGGLVHQPHPCALSFHFGMSTPFAVSHRASANSAAKAGSMIQGNRYFAANAGASICAELKTT